MNRRNFALLASSSLIALQATVKSAKADTAPASALGAGLTPMGSEQAGNADGSIPAWTGGMTTLPAGIQPNDYVPELFPGEQPVVVIDSSNLADHAAMLSDGLQAMITKYGMKIKVYPTHRTAAMPQYVYDNIAANHGRAKFTPQDPIGGRFGFQGGYGGVPFPVPDTSNPLTAGAQIMWNHCCRYLGFCNFIAVEGWAVSQGQLVLTIGETLTSKYPYYDPNGSLETFDGWLQKTYSPYTAPANSVGQAIEVWFNTNPYAHPQQAWEMLNGQGRVRRAPEISFDTPSAQTLGIANYDEFYGFNGSLERYDWKYLGKQEMYVPYNNNGLYAASPQQAHLDHFLNPDLVRFEKHRCWVVEATLHPGENNVLHRRRFYFDEDTWTVVYADAWDANNELFHINLMYNNCRPDLPGIVYGNNTVHNLQVQSYVSIEGTWNQSKTKSSLKYVSNYTASVFDPESMAASSQY